MKQRVMVAILALCAATADAQIITHQASVTLSHDQIAALPSVRAVVIAAPGPGRVSVPTGTIVLHGHFTGGQYGNLDPDWSSLVFYYEGRSNELSAYVWSASFLNSGNEGLRYPVAGVNVAFGIPTGRDHEAVENLAVVLAADNAVGDFTGGHPANTLDVAIEFRIYDTTLKRFLTTAESGWSQATRSFAKVRGK